MKKFILLFICLTLLLSGCQNSKEPIEEETISESGEEEIEEKPEIYKASLIMAGDALIHDSVYNANETSDGNYDFTYALSELKKIVSNYDIAYYNQESILGGKENGLSNYPALNSPKEAGEAFVDAGFNLVSLANNHTLDRYGNGDTTLIESSHDFWTNQEGVITSGSYISEEDKDEIRIGEKNGITYALLSYTYGTNGYTVEPGEEYLVNYIDRDQIKNDVEKYRDKVDLLIVAVHWGEEYSYVPTKEQTSLAQYLADLDVDIVVGNHAHVVEPIEWIDDTLVIYALGNIISGQYFSVETLTGALCSLDVVKTVEDGVSEVSLENVKCELVYTLNQDEKWKIVPYSELDDTTLKDSDKYFAFFKGILQANLSEETINEANNADLSYLYTYATKPDIGISGLLSFDYPDFSNITPYTDLEVDE